MMNNTEKIFLCAVTVMSLFTSCSVKDYPGGGINDEVASMPVQEDVVKGELLVRFDARVSDVLEASGVVT